MIDTMRAYLNGEKLIGCGEQNANHLLSSMQRYANFREVATAGGTRYYTGNLKNLQVWYSPIEGLTIEGSIPKYRNGENISTLSRGNTEEAFRELESECGYPIGEASISRLDLGICVQTEQPPQLYYQAFVHCPNHTRETRDNSLLFQSKSSPIILYDKVAETKKSEGGLPESWQNALNLLRFEAKLKGHIPRQLGVPSLVVSDLYNESVWSIMATELEKRWESIQKINPTTAVCAPTTAKQVREFAFAQRLSDNGIGAHLEQLQALRNAGTLPPKEYKRAVDEARRAFETFAQTSAQAKQLVEELDGKVRTAINEALRM